MHLRQRGHGPGSCAKRLQGLLMDTAKAAVRHEDDQISGFSLFHDRRHDVVDRRGRPRTLTRAFEVAHELLSGEPLGLWQTRAEHGRNDDLVGGSERAREVLLEYAAARRRRAWLENGPDALMRIRRAE